MSLNRETIQLKEGEYKLLKDLVYQKTGILLDERKKSLLSSRLMKRILFHDFMSFQEYYNFIIKKDNSDELIEMIDAISTNLTSFYRETVHFDFLKKIALPDIIQRKKKERKIRAWCAASSTGEEPYTILMTLKEFLDSSVDWDIKLLATDISTKVLAKAKQGLYNEKKVETISPVELKRYFDKQIHDDEVYYQVKPAFKSLAVFRRFNLMCETFPFKGKFDFIFCRNVMIYFDKSTQKTLVSKLVDYLEVGGYLFVGHSESFVGVVKDRLKTLAPATFQKIK